MLATRAAVLIVHTLYCTMESSLRVWVGVVGSVAVLNAAQCYWNTATAAERIYTLEPLQGTVDIAPQ